MQNDSVLIKVVQDLSSFKHFPKSIASIALRGRLERHKIEVDEKEYKRLLKKLVRTLERLGFRKQIVGQYEPKALNLQTVPIIRNV